MPKQQKKEKWAKQKRMICFQCSKRVLSHHWDRDLNVCKFCANEVYVQSYNVYGEDEYYGNKYTQALKSHQENIEYQQFNKERKIKERERIRQEKEEQKKRELGQKIVGASHSDSSMRSLIEDINQAVGPSIQALKEAMDEVRRQTKQLCSFCHREHEAVYVHGHYQCTNCKQVIVPCCNGETAQADA